MRQAIDPRGKVMGIERAESSREAFERHTDYTVVAPEVRA